MAILVLDGHKQQIVQERYGTRTTTSSLTQEEISALMCYPSITLTCCVSVPQSYGLAGRRFVTRRSILIPACADDVRQRGPYDAQDVPARPLLFTDRCSLPGAMGYLFPNGTSRLFRRPAQVRRQASSPAWRRAKDAQARSQSPRGAPQHWPRPRPTRNCVPGPDPRTAGK